MKEVIEQQIKCGGSPEAILVLAKRVLPVLCLIFLIGCSGEKVVPTQTDTGFVPFLGAGESQVFVGMILHHRTEHAQLTVIDIQDGQATLTVRINGSAQITASVSSQHLIDAVVNNSDWTTESSYARPSD